MKIFVLLFSVLVVGCTSVNNAGGNNQNPEAFVGIENGNLVYRGGITETSNNAIFALFNDAEVKPGRLLITSQGGEIGAGLDLGQWVKDNGLDVEVERVCASSCANYIFPAANKKYLRKDSVLLWHGSAWQADWSVDDKNRQTFAEYITGMRKQETEFYASIGVDNLLAIYGQSKFSALDFAQNLFGKGTVGYDYSIADMERFGLKNIVLIDGEWDWRKYRPKSADRVKRINVDEGFEFKLRRFEI